MTGPGHPSWGEAVRRALLAVAIAELCAGDPADVRCPVCPMCDEGPAMVLPAWQAMCGNDSCPVFMWDPRKTREQFRQEAKPVRLQTRRPDGTWEDEQ